MRDNRTFALLILLLLPVLLARVPDEAEPERVTIFVSDDSLIARARELGVPYRDLEAGIAPILIGEAERIVDDLRSKGLRLEVVEILTHTAHGVIADLYGGEKGLDDLGLEIFPDEVLELNLQKSVPLVGAREAQNHRLQNGENLTGMGVVVAIVDTGVDYNHPDLGGGLGPGRKVIGGYDFIDEDNDPMDIHGHGTHVAGIAAGKGGITGIAPDAKLLAYRIVENGGRVRTSNVARAIERAAKDGADVINLSLGARFEVKELRGIVRNAMDAGIIVVAAVGNSGPVAGSIGDPASQTGTIAVGSEYNDRPTRLALVTIEDQGIEIVGLPMEDSVDTGGTVSGEIVFVKYARPGDVGGLDLRRKIALAERRGENSSDMVFFSTKEASVAERGAIGLIVFNTEPGVARGRLRHQNNPPGYEPSIPTMFITRDDGIQILKRLQQQKVVGSVTFQNSSHKDRVSLFSSRGPISPFYIKPDLISPGERINSTWLGGLYATQDGTSFAAPHVSGAAALLIQLHGKMTKEELIGVLGPSAEPLLSSFDLPWPADHQGSGRLDLARAIRSPVSIAPHQFSMNLAEGQANYSRSIRIDSLVDSPTSISVSTTGDFWPRVMIKVNRSSLVIDGRGSRFVGLSAQLLARPTETARLEGRLLIRAENRPEPLTLTLPIVVNINTVSVNVTRVQEGFQISLISPSRYERGVVRVAGPNMLEDFEREILEGESISFSPEEPGEYWVEASVFDGQVVEFGGVTFFAEGTGERVEQPIALRQQVPVRFLQLLLGSITVIAIGASLYLLAVNGRRRS